MAHNVIRDRSNREICALCNSLLSGRLEGKTSHHSSIEDLRNSTTCPLCGLFCSAMEGARLAFELPSETFTHTHLKSYLEYYEARNGNAITIMSLKSWPDFSKQMPFRFLRPYSGKGTNGRRGRVVGMVNQDTPYMRATQKRGIWAQRDSQLDDRLGIIKSWLAECSAHKSCTHDELILPKRVIDVDSMALYETGTYSTGHYAALSYCWGRDSSGSEILTMKTTANNLEDRKTSLCLEGEILHKTFADAITITRGLGIRYLWIDALCIVQGDDGDFESEASKMAAYYENAALTLAATDSAHCEGGMLYPANYRERFNTVQFIHQDQTVYGFLESIQTDLERDINSAPLNQRGWVLQEGILSRRMVHFCKKQLIWECATEIASEDGLVVLNKYDIRRPFASSTLWVPSGSRYQEWDAVIQDYSSRLLSKTKDKTLALAGATTRFMHLLHDEPLLGLWKGDIHAGLLWKATEPRGHVNASELKSIPSWSWMVVDGPITFGTKHRSDFRSSPVFEMSMEVKEVFVKWKGKELTSEVTQTSLIVSGRLIPFQPSSSTIGDIWWDSPSQPDGSIFLLLVAQVKYRPGTNWNGKSRLGTKDYFLILSETLKKDVYSRVGMGVATNKEGIGGHFADQSEETIVLV